MASICRTNYDRQGGHFWDIYCVKAVRLVIPNFLYKRLNVFLIVISATCSIAATALLVLPYDRTVYTASSRGDSDVC